ncbi:MAG: threonine--tRNA ligase, partial [Candidatus Omnitrophica bacterium]|nr:threonine--tRNA ligase [Candidatus Omnitrophota bacterium]
EFAIKIKEYLQNAGLRVIIDERNESLNKKIREGTVKKTPYLIIVGDKEVADKILSVRQYGQGETGTVTQEEFLEQVLVRIKEKN